MTRLSHYTVAPLSGKKPKQLIVLLHGYGSNGRDLISLAPYWHSAVPDALFVSPDAPFPCEMAPEMGYQWFSLVDRTPEKDEAGAKAASEILNGYLDELLEEHDLTDENLALVGFSQGTMMSLYVGPRRKRKIAGILGYSGALIGGSDLETSQKPPIHLIHGEADSVVPVEKYHEAVKVLKDNSFLVSGHTTVALEHSIDNDGVESGSAFLSKIFN